MAKKSPTTKVTSKKAAKKTSKNKIDSSSIQESQLMKLFEDELKDIYWAEKALTKAIPKMVKNATSPDLKTALESHLQETLVHVTRLENVFGLLGKKPAAKKCEAMAGLIEEASEIMKDCDKGAMRDAGIISAGQKVEHYEIASYGTLCQFSKTLGLGEAKKILGLTLNEEKGADKKLTEVAEASINLMAAHQKA
ncbi:ferritin-like domain-containing protein [uncultured Cytophaga sp.]|uniref:YciE/YciF ferroxidase family protein n=1 Tax=uncultured Cytophaga sp. TaxID=160238 RepID=UPI002632D6A1|nr:ferritin-like domain-containing protein [uncultured Cytophaga sp.]